MKGKDIVFKELLEYISHKKFADIVKKHEADKWCKSLYSWDLLIILLHGHLSGEKSLRSLELSHAIQGTHLKDMKASRAARSTLSDACKVRNPAVFKDVFTYLVDKVRVRGKLDKLSKTFIHLIDSTPIILKGHGYDWAGSNYRITGLKMHTVYDESVKSPIYIDITAPTVNDITPAKDIEIESGGTYVFDKAYFDYTWWNTIDQKGSYFVSRLKSNTPYKIVERHATLAEGITHDWTIQLSSRKGRAFKSVLRHIRVRLDNKKSIEIVSNDLKSSATQIAQLYKRRWNIELFFKCIKQHLKIKRFWGKSENAVLLQLLVGMIAYLLLRLAQTITQCKLSIYQISILIRAKLYANCTLFKLLRAPDKLISKKREVNYFPRRML